jgi:hypothetical protein
MCKESMVMGNSKPEAETSKLSSRFEGSDVDESESR